MFSYNKTLVEFDLVQHKISFAGSSDFRLSLASPNITCPGKTNLMLDLVSSNKCLMCLINKRTNAFCLISEMFLVLDKGDPDFDYDISFFSFG